MSPARFLVELGAFTVAICGVVAAVYAAAAMMGPVQ